MTNALSSPPCNASSCCTHGNSADLGLFHCVLVPVALSRAAYMHWSLIVSAMIVHQYLLMRNIDASALNLVVAT